MKKILLPLLLIGFAFTASAQHKAAPAAKPAAETAKTLNAEEYELDEATYIRVKQAYTTHLNKKQDLRKKLANDNLALTEALEKEQVEFDKQMRSLMNARQFAIYESKTKPASN